MLVYSNLNRDRDICEMFQPIQLPSFSPAPAIPSLDIDKPDKLGMICRIILHFPAENSSLYNNRKNDCHFKVNLKSIR